MNKRIIAVALAGLMLLLALPANAAIQATSVEVRGQVWTETQKIFSWTPQNFAGFYYDLKDDLGKENLTINADIVANLSSVNRSIPKSKLTYSTMAQPKDLKVINAVNRTALADKGLEQTGDGKAFFNGSYYVVGWQAQKYVAVNGKVDKLSKLILEHGTSTADKKTLTVGETWDIGDGWTLAANSIDAKATPRQVWLTLSKDGVKKDDKVISAGTTDAKPIYTYVEKSFCSETDVPLFVTYVDSVFAGATTDMVQLRYTWLISSTCTEIKSGDTYGVFKNAQVSGKNLTLTNDDNSVSLTRDNTVTLNGALKFFIADSDALRFYAMAMYTEPGTYEVRGSVWDQDKNTMADASWNPQKFAGFYYDLKDDLGRENLTIDASVNLGGPGANKSIPKSKLSYQTMAQPKDLKVVNTVNRTALADKGLEQTGDGKAFFNGSYYIIGWQAQPYVAVNGKADKLSKLILEHGTSTADKKTLTVGETWDIGDGWTLTANSIDAKATPRQVWLTLTKDGVKKDDKVISAGTTDAKPIYTYVEKSFCGETDVPLFVTYVDSVFAGATTDMVQLRYTWLISSTCTEIKSGDTYGVFKNAQVSGKNLSMLNDDNTVSLSRDSTVTLMGEMKFKTADSDTLRFYPVVEYQIGVGPTETTPVVTGGTTVVTTQVGNTTVPPATGVTTGGVAGATTTAAGPAATTQPTPGFEAVFAIAGLLAVAFLVLRQRK